MIISIRDNCANRLDFEYINIRKKNLTFLLKKKDELIIALHASTYSLND
jgi:hypothetical protein